MAAQVAVELTTGDKIKEKKRLVVGSCGDARTGKTHFTFTAPKKIGLVPLDRNSIPTYKKLEKEMGMVGSVYYPAKPLIDEKDVQRMLKPMRMSAVMRQEAEGKTTKEGAKLEGEIEGFYRGLMDRVTDLCFAYYDKPDVETVVIDTGSQLYDYGMFAHFGRHVNVVQRTRGPLNQELRDLINSCGKNLIITHPVKDEYKNDKRTGRRIIDGWPLLSYNTSVCIEHFKVDDRYARRHFLEEYKQAGADEDEVEEMEEELDEIPAFGVKVYDSQANPMLTRDKTILIGPRCNFPWLAVQVFPDTDVEDWSE